MGKQFYQYELPQRRRMLADQGFVRSAQRVWAHPDGRAIGEGVAAALTDAAFCRFLELVEPVKVEPENSAQPPAEAARAEGAAL